MGGRANRRRSPPPLFSPFPPFDGGGGGEGKGGAGGGRGEKTAEGHGFEEAKSRLPTTFG